MGFDDGSFMLFSYTKPEPNKVLIDSSIQHGPKKQKECLPGSHRYALTLPTISKNSTYMLTIAFLVNWFFDKIEFHSGSHIVKEMIKTV
jgi:hypothetical protein